MSLNNTNQTKPNLCVCFVHRSLSDASDSACSVRPYFYLRLFLRMHSDQTEFCVSYDFLIASSRAPIVKAPLCSDMALIFLRPEGSQMFRSAQFFMNLKRERKSINHGVAYKGSSLSLVIENHQVDSLHL